jgi:hypothetical protein
VIIRNSNNPKYYVVKGHPKYYSRGNNTVSTKNKTNVSKGGNRSGNNSVGKTKGGGKGKNKS